MSDGHDGEPIQSFITSLVAQITKGLSNIFLAVLLKDGKLSLLHSLFLVSEGKYGDDLMLLWKVKDLVPEE